MTISSLVGCGSIQEKVVLKTDYVVKEIPLQPRPKPLNLHRVRFHAVTPENLNEFLVEYEKINGDVVFFAISVPDYENLSLNVAEMKRFINQQKSLIIYYEESIGKMEEDLPADTEEVIKDRAYGILFARKFDEELENTLRTTRAEAFVEFKELD